MQPSNKSDVTEIATAKVTYAGGIIVDRQTLTVEVYADLWKHYL